MSLTNSLLWLIAIPFISSPLVYLVGRIALRIDLRLGQKHNHYSRSLALISMAISWVPLTHITQSIISGKTVEIEAGSILLRMDGIGLILAVTALGLGTLVTIFSFPYISGDEGEEKYYALLPAMVGSIIGLGCAVDLFNLWVWFEAMTVSSYLLVAFYTQQRGSLEAGLKYLVQSAVGSVLILMGIALVFAHTGTLRLDEIASWNGPFSLTLLAAGAQFLIGFGVKAAIVPMHTWLPDAHSQAPSGISALLSGVVIEAGLIAMLRSLGNLPVDMRIWGNLLMFFGAGNILFGNLMALRQNQVKRLLAYSSLSHVGYMLLGFGVAASFRSELAAAGGFFHLFTHATMKGLAFLAAGSLLFGIHIARGNHEPLIIDDLNGASRFFPVEAFGLSVAVLALGGLPPLAGFMSKWQIFTGGVETKNFLVIFLIIFAALNSVLSLAYYAPLVNRLYRKEPSQSVIGSQSKTVMRIPVVVLTLVVVALGVWPVIIQTLTSPAATTYLALFSNNIHLAGH